MAGLGVEDAGDLAGVFKELRSIWQELDGRTGAVREVATASAP